MTESKIVWIL